MIRALRRLGAAALLAGCAGLAGCAAGPGITGPTVTAAEFAAGERTLRQAGRLRTDRAASDVPVTGAALARNFARIAFGLEEVANRGRTLHRLHRREGPVRWSVQAAGPDGAAATADVARTFARIAAASGLDIAPAGSGQADFHVLFLGPQDYAGAAAWARRAMGRPEARLIEDFRTSRALCTGSVRVRESAAGGLPAGAHEHAIVLVRAGYSDLLRLGCVEEEIAQALGLANDDRSVRPSVFNDDEEFALLTRHDELLLRILYDRRLSAGMTPAEAMPIVVRIVEELRPGG